MVTVKRDALTVGTAVEFVVAGDPLAVTFVQVGHPVLGCELRIAGDTGAELPDAAVGHIQIRGDNICRGYYLDPQSTQAAISIDGWLDTGDLGFRSDGGLTITGRAKEILFIGGQNYYPHDLEAVIEKHAGIEPGKVAVCGVRPDNAATDDVLAFVLYRGDLRDFVTTIGHVRKCVNEQIGIVVGHVIPVAKIPKTTSGKIQRYLLAAAYQNGEFRDVLIRLHELAATAPSTVSEAHSEIEKTLKEICDAFLKDRPFGMHDNLFELGTSSLTLAQIYERIETVYPGQLEVTDFFDYPTIADLAKYLEGRLKANHA
jgi:acyl carrier protein